MIVTRDFEGELILGVSGGYSRFDLKRTSDKNESRLPDVSHQFDAYLEDGKIRLSVEGNELLLLTFK